MKRACHQGKEAKRQKTQLNADVMEITTAKEGGNVEESTTSTANDTSEKENQTVNEEPSSSKSKRNSITYSGCFQYEKIDGKQVGLCLLCKKKSNTTKHILMKNSNTTGLKKHLAAIHTSTYIEMFGSDPTKKNNNETPSLKQRKLTDYEKQNVRIIKPDVDSFAKATVKWLAFKRLPLSFFDDEPTQTYFSQINSDLIYPKKDKMKRTLEEEFSTMSSKVKEILQNNSSKISFAVDGWTSSVGLKSYYGITCHFINDNWELQSFAISFLSSGGQHSGKDIAQTFLKSLNNYEIKNKVQGITVDNCASNTTFMVELANIMNKYKIKFDPEVQHFRCFAHILNLGVQDILKLLRIDGTCFEDSSYVSRDLDDENGEEAEGHDDDDYELNTSEENSENKIANPIKKLRMTFLKLRRSEKLQNKLVSCCDTTNTKYRKPILDVKTRWNSTYNMINLGIILRPALKLLFENAEELKIYKILDDEWSMMSYINTFLKHFNAVSTALAGEKYVTLPLAVVAFNLLLDKIDTLINELFSKQNKTEVEQIILEAFIAGKNKLMKHYNKANWIYGISLILDPRHKVEAFNLTTWGKEMKEYTIQIFEKIFKQGYFTEDLLIDDCILQPDLFDLEEDTLNLNALYVAHNTDGENGWRKEIDEYLSAREHQGTPMF